MKVGGPSVERISLPRHKVVNCNRLSNNFTNSTASQSFRNKLKLLMIYDPIWLKKQL